MNQLSTADRERVIACLVEGNSHRAGEGTGWGTGPVLPDDVMEAYHE